MFDVSTPTLSLGAYHEYRPPARARRACECFWVHSIPPRAPDPAPLFHRVLPHFGASLVFERTWDRRGGATSPRLLFQGPSARPEIFPFTPGKELVAVRLKPEWTASVLGPSAGDHWEAIDDFAEMRPDVGGRLLADLVRTRSAREALHRLAGWAVARIERTRGDGSAMLTTRAVLDRLRMSNGMLRLADLSREQGRTPQHLTRTVRDQLATTPKQVARLLRFNAVIAKADRERRPRWAELATAGGYFDQAHLVNECRVLSDQTPKLLHEERRSQFDFSNTGAS